MIEYSEEALREAESAFARHLRLGFKGSSQLPQIAGVARTVRTQA
ncbi:hypothetical protein HDC93_000758 [Streptomyces sp. AK010]|nr:hypothetical protein [Streptomyces sp. AK010]